MTSISFEYQVNNNFFTPQICSYCTALLINIDITIVLSVIDYKPQTTNGLQHHDKQFVANLQH